MAHIQWYPGHMAKAKKEVQSQLSAVDIVLEIRDARIPTASMNPMLDEIIKNKRHMIVLNKQDLADPQQTKEWVKALSGENKLAIALDSKKLGDMKIFRQALKDFTQDIQDKWRNKGILHKSIRVMVIGIPNVGKSTFINQFTKQKKAQVGNKPGVTKGQQWIKIDKDFELLDTPGILWPKFEDQKVGLKLAFIGSIKDEILNTEELACEFIQYMKQEYGGVLNEKYHTDESDDSYQILMGIARSRHCLVRGNELDTEKAAALLLDDFRNGRLGRITLEKCLNKDS